jgi:hypothetical protein
MRTKTCQVEEKHQINFHREFILFLSVPLFLTLTINQLAPFEILTLTFFMILLLSVYFYNVYFKIITPQLRWIYPLFLLFSLLTMSQMNAEKADKISNKGNKGWFSINAFGSAGSYPNKHFDCNGNVTEILKRNYSTVGAGVSYHYKPTVNRHLTISTNIYSDADRSNELYAANYQSTAFNLMASYSSKYAGGTLGLSVGSWEATANQYMPAIGLWVGRKDYIFAETNLMTDYHLMGPPGGLQVGIGSGFGQVDRSLGRAGLSIMPSIGLFGDKGYVLGRYFSGDIQIRDKFTLKPSLFVGREFGGSLGLQMHLGKGRWKSKAESRNYQ